MTHSTWWYAALFIAAGFPATAFNTGLITGAQDASPPSVRVRVLALVGVAEALGQGGGILTPGMLAGSVPLPALLNGQASCYLACAGIAAAGLHAPASLTQQKRRLRVRPEQSPRV